jgi:transmembrane sensor
MEYERLQQLIDKMEHKTATVDEQLELDAFYQSFENDSGLTGSLTDADLFGARLETDIQTEIARRKYSHTRHKLWPRIAVAAAIATMVLGAGVFFFKNSQKTTEYIASTTDMAPGKQGATLTLASGKKIRLNGKLNGELANEAGVVITKTADGQLIYEIRNTSNQGNQINTLSTAKGETYRVRLPDSSTVWLNAASSLTYAVDLLKSGKRTVKLEGEAFFAVTKDKSHPFVVQTHDQQVEVLGTQFNINSYPDENVVATTLLEGSVKVISRDVQMMIKPGDQALNQGGKIRVAKVSVENFVDWKEGDFNLNNLNFKVAMRKIARWYDVEVQFDESVPNSISSGGWISRGKRLSEVLKFIESSGIAKFRLEGRILFVYR